MRSELIEDSLCVLKGHADEPDVSGVACVEFDGCSFLVFVVNSNTFLPVLWE